jgi:2-iminoacetate synthase ThiH
MRAVALARITGPASARIGVDWGRSGLEVAQVALGFGASELTGPITRKSGALIREDELKKVKGKGMVAATALRRREISALVRNAGRACVFVSQPEASPEASRHPEGELEKESDSDPREASYA